MSKYLSHKGDDYISVEEHERLLSAARKEAFEECAALQCAGCANGLTFDADLRRHVIASGNMTNNCYAAGIRLAIEAASKEGQN